MTGLALGGFLAAGMPIAFALIAATFAFMLASSDMRLLEALPQIMFGSIEIFDLLAIPLFILLGELMNEGGMTRRIVGATRAWLFRVKNSLAYVCLLANLILAAIMGSAVAQIAVMSRVMVPEMEKDGYDRGFASALTASAGLLGPIIPPSMPFIIYGVVGQVSVADMFAGGILPGLMLFGFMCVFIALAGSRPNAGAAVAPPTMAERLKISAEALATLAIPFVIVGGISAGLVTPTESAAIAVAVAIIVGGFFYRELKFSDLAGILDRTAANTATVLFLVVAAKLFGWVLTFNQVPQATAGFLQSLTDNPILFMLLVFLILNVVGMFLDGIAALIILVPILLPIATGAYGIDPVHFGIMMCLTLILGLLTPPVGAGLFIASSINGIGVVTLSRLLLPFVLMTALVILAVIVFPVLTRPFG